MTSSENFFFPVINPGQSYLISQRSLPKALERPNQLQSPSPRLAYIGDELEKHRRHSCRVTCLEHIKADAIKGDDSGLSW